MESGQQAERASLRARQPVVTRDACARRQQCRTYVLPAQSAPGALDDHLCVTVSIRS